MTYKTDEYHKLDRNHTRMRSTLNWIDTARDFNRMKFCEKASIIATDRDGFKIEIALGGKLKDVILSAGAQHSIDSAKKLNEEKMEDVDFGRAASI